MARSLKGGVVISGLVILLVVAALGGGAVYLGKIAPPSQKNVHHILKLSQTGTTTDTHALPELPPIPSSGQ